MDMPDQPGQLYAAFVMAKAPPHSTITGIDTSKAMVSRSLNDTPETTNHKLLGHERCEGIF